MTSSKAPSSVGFFEASARDVYFAKRKQELAMLRDPATGKVRADMSAPIESCLLCGSPQRRVVFEKEGFEFCRCAQCGFIYANPQIREEALMAFYENSSYDAWVDVLLSDTNRNYDRQKYTQGLELIEQQLGHKGRILDVGCSVGFFLDIARTHGWDTVGLELNQRAVKHASGTLGLDVRQRLLEDCELEPGSFDAVTLWGVIEHLKTPKAEIERVAKLLKPGGMLLVFCPNVESLACRVLRERAATFDGQVHCGYFSPVTLNRLLEDCGFETLHMSAAQADIRSIFRYLDFQDPYQAVDEPGTRLLDQLPAGSLEQLEEFVLANNLGYKMMALGRRP